MWLLEDAHGTLGKIALFQTNYHLLSQHYRGRTNVVTDSLQVWLAIKMLQNECKIKFHLTG